MIVDETCSEGQVVTLSADQQEDSRAGRLARRYARAAAQAHPRGGPGHHRGVEVAGGPGLVPQRVSVHGGDLQGRR